MSPLNRVVLLLFMFAANVLPSRTRGYQNSGNNIHQVKSSHYVRTFTKYHHRRPIIIQHHNHWPLQQDHQKTAIKRSVPFSNVESNWPYEHEIRKRNSESANFIGKVESVKNQFIPVSDKSKFAIGKQVAGKVVPAKNVMINEAKNAKTMSCLYKIHSVSISITPSYDDDKDAQIMVENDNFELGVITRSVLPNGDYSQIEQCTDPNASCYTLWHQDRDGNITVLGQGCWRSSQKDNCDKCTRVNPRLPGTKFCCCTRSSCNGDFLSLREEIIPLKVESTMESPQTPNYSNAIASAILALAAILVMAVVMRKTYCRQIEMNKDEADGLDVEKGDAMGSGPDALATGLSCVDNLTLIEHIGQGKFGSVWRGSLGSTAVAVKLYTNQSNWQKEAGIYSMPQLAHPNILKYYGSDTRPTLTEGGGREHLIVLELCPATLRQRLQRGPVTWREFATLAHGLASALAHLHNATPTKPCIVHRDINSNNVLITCEGEARLADLGLAHTMRPRLDNTAHLNTEAGTVRYLAPEALEGAIDVSGAMFALRCVDVFALALVLWEMLWRCSGAHCGATPPYMLPYGSDAEPQPSVQHMQNLVSRNKVRPPLPNGPVAESRALKIACETCDECWDHDAEARLTAVCVEERMSELKQMLQAKGPVIHDNNLHPSGTGDAPTPETDKNSNCTTNQTCDVTTPLLYPHPHIGRNACIQRNTNTHENTQTNTHTLIHKSLKDISTERNPNTDENVLSVARYQNRQVNDNSDRLNEIRSYQRPLDYVPNDVSYQEIDRAPKETNLLHDKPKWGIKRFFERKSSKNKLETEVKLVQDIGNSTRTSIVNDKPCNIYNRPSNLVLDDSIYNMEAPCLSPPNRTLSPTMMMESQMNRSDKVFAFKELPSAEKEQNQIFAVIVPKAKPNYIEMKKTQGSSDSINKSICTMSSQSMFKYGNSESEDSTIKKRLSDKIITNTNSGRSSRASINLELQYMDNQNDFSPFEVNSDCSSSEDENLMLLSENGGSKITMQSIPKQDDKKKLQNDVLKEATRSKTVVFNHQNKYSNFDNEFSDPNDKENLITYSGDNPVYLAALNGEIDSTDLKIFTTPVSPKPSLKSLAIKRQHSLEQVCEIFSSSGDLNLQNPAGRVKTPGDLPVAVRRARRERALQKGRANESNRLSLYDDRMMFGNSL